MKTWVLFCLFMVTLNVASKCPESRKPHKTNCNLFYSCVDLPTGEFVWKPDKCDDDLIFEPYLKTCILPEKPKDCGGNLKVSESMSFINNNKYNENLDPSYFFNKNSDDSENSPGISLNYNLETSNSPQTTENIIYQLVSNYKIDIPSTKTSENNDTYLSLLNTLITKILIKDNNIKTQFPELNQNISKFSNQKIDLANVDQNCESLILQCLSKKQNLDDVEYKTDYEDKLLNKVISFTDNFGNRQYISVNKFLLLKDKLNLESLSILDCIKGVRLPNATDCTKYYTCNYETIVIIKDYTCPKYTAFNKETRLCDVKSHLNCEKTSFRGLVKTIYTNLNLNSDYANVTCKSKGKIIDAKSRHHYYLCYEDKALFELKAVRLECPRFLIFCKEKNVCTTNELCYS